MNKEQVEQSKSLLGEDAVEMLMQTHQDALWMLENLGVGCRQPEILEAFQQYVTDERVIIYENRVYITADLVKQCPTSLCQGTVFSSAAQPLTFMMT